MGWNRGLIRGYCSSRGEMDEGPLYMKTTAKPWTTNEHAFSLSLSLVLFLSLSLYRFTLAPELHPDWMLLLWFAHTHLTVTVTLGLMIVPKVNLSF